MATYTEDPSPAASLIERFELSTIKLAKARTGLAQIQKEHAELRASLLGQAPALESALVAAPPVVPTSETAPAPKRSTHAKRGQQKANREVVLAYIQAQPRPVHRTKVARHFGMNVEAVGIHLNRLVASGDIARTLPGTFGPVHVPAPLGRPGPTLTKAGVGEWYIANGPAHLKVAAKALGVRVHKVGAHVARLVREGVLVRTAPATYGPKPAPVGPVSPVVSILAAADTPEPTNGVSHRNGFATIGDAVGVLTPSPSSPVVPPDVLRTLMGLTLQERVCRSLRRHHKRFGLTIHESWIYTYGKRGAEFAGIPEEDIRRALDALITDGAVQRWPALRGGQKLEVVAAHRFVRKLTAKLDALGLR